ncbi:Small-conductance mechanosensitive channel [bioreactor metagenome]|uniref:Small-conductance mechanosensitive channel n=1 Tax=bioreactor metagenome TaxID=1076179 RepID=A0A644SWP9_9ZZZZ|nr:mechanosensitive ion channel family protein [Negativicutes bacterium]
MIDLMTSDFWLAASNKIIRVVLIILVAWLILTVLSFIAGRLFNSAMGSKTLKFDEKRTRTFSHLLQSFIRYGIYIITIMQLLREFNIDTTSIIAGAGIIGLAIGVGAQSLIKDFVTGFFMILEDQYSVGDYIVLEDMAGTVEDIGFRVTKLRDANGVLHIIPHGVISRVSNYNRGHMVATVNVPIAYQADLDKVLALLDEACVEIGKTMPEVLEGPSIVGVVDFLPGEIVARLSAKTIPLQQVKVEAALRYKIKLLFDKAGIPVPAVFTIKQGG